MQAGGRQRRRRSVLVGDVFVIPIPGGGYGLGQSVGDVDDDVMDCVLFDYDSPDVPSQLPDISALRPIAVHGTWKLPVKRGHWHVLGNVRPVLPVGMIPNQERLKRRPGGEGTEWCDPSLLEQFLAAWFGRIPWNSMADPRQFDKYLCAGVGRPAGANVLSFDERRELRARAGLPTVREAGEH